MSTVCGGKIGPFDCCSIVHGDSEQLLGSLPNGSCQAIITDPPYGVAIDHWDSRILWRDQQQFLRIATGPIVWFGAAPQMPNAFRNFEPPPERTLIWAPSFTLSHVMANKIAFRFHPIWTWRLPDKHDGPVWDVLDTPTESGNWFKYPCSKPTELLRKLVGFVRNEGIILDPYMGSGSTLLAARMRGRHFLGFDNSQEAVDITNQRFERGEAIWPDAGIDQPCLFSEI